MEIKEETPSVIARLMGLDELRHQRPIHKQYRVLSEDYLRKSASIGLLLKQSSYGGRSFRKSRVKKPEFKDVFEGQEQQIQYIQTISKKMETSWAAKESIRFEKQNSKDAQCVELDEKILDSLKFSDTLENVRSNKEMLLKYLQKRDILFHNHSHDQLCTHSPSGQSIVVKLSSDPCYKEDENCWKLDKTAVRRDVLRAPQKLQYDSDTLKDLHNDLQNISNMQVKVKNGIPVNDEAKDTGNPIISLEPCKHNFITSRKTVMENELSTISTEVSRSEIGADDTCVNETKPRTPFRSSFSDLKNQEQVLYPYSNWSSFNREANNIDAGWRKMAKKVQLGTTTKFPTISEMLYSSDQKRPETTYKLKKTGFCSKLSQNSEKSKLSRPSGVNSKNGMKNDVVNKSSRFRSFPSFPNAAENSISENHNDAFHNDEYLRREEVVTGAGNRFRNQKFSEKGESKPEDSIFSCETSPSSGYMDLEYNHSTEESLFNELGNKLEDKKLSGEISKKSELSEVSHILVDQESPIGSPKDDQIFSSCFEFEPELTSSWRDTHQPSPNSVLNSPYEQEILSDIECFEGAGPAGANLIGLWKQLQLLKSDVEDTISEGPGMMVSSDEGTRDASDDFLKENGKSGVFRAKETRDFSYLVDVLDEAGFYDANWEIDIDKWHSPESAVNHSVFEVLEKKYGDQIFWESSERRLLFDRMNSGLMEILQPCLDIPEWANSLSTWLGTLSRRDVIEEKLWNLLVSQEEEVNKGLSEKAVGGDIRWLKLGGDIDIIVREIENSLFDELVAELARAITGVVTNPALNGQIPFAKPNGANFPLNNGVPGNSGNNGLIDNNNIPFLTGLAGSKSNVLTNNGNNNGFGFPGAQLPVGSALQKLMFGTMTVIDDELTEGHELGSGLVGKAQGFYVVSSEDGNSQTMAFTAMFEDGGYADSLSFFGVHRTVVSESQLAIMGGTGKYVNAKGFAVIKTLPIVNQQATDGLETLLEFTVYITY